MAVWSKLKRIPIWPNSSEEISPLPSESMSWKILLECL
jgi:hypothetical protein